MASAARLGPPQSRGLPACRRQASGEPKTKKSREKKGKEREAAAAEGDGEEAVDPLPWAVPEGFVVAPRPAAEALVPMHEAGKALVGLLVETAVGRLTRAA